jgi:molecular chaperone GrpE (heat shock protein)
MSQLSLKSLLQKAREVKARVNEISARIADLKSKLAAAEAAPIQYASVDTSSQDALLELAAAKLKVEILPQQIAEVDSAKGDAVCELLEVADSLKRAIREALTAEQQKVAAEIVSVLEPYNVTARVNGENINPALSVAWGMPIITNMESATEPFRNTSPPSQIRVTYPEQFDSTTLELADAVMQVADSYIANGDSFIPEFFKKKKKR